MMLLLLLLMLCCRRAFPQDEMMSCGGLTKDALRKHLGNLFLKHYKLEESQLVNLTYRKDPKQLYNLVAGGKGHLLGQVSSIFQGVVQAAQPSAAASPNSAAAAVPKGTWIYVSFMTLDAERTKQILLPTDMDTLKARICDKFSLPPDVKNSLTISVKDDKNVVYELDDVEAIDASKESLVVKLEIKVAIPWSEDEESKSRTSGPASGAPQGPVPIADTTMPIKTVVATNEAILA
jgi:hypothetical protein